MAAYRLGDIIDDYCPRCRMLANHSIAAMLGAEVKKVVCRTCQNQHDYKDGKAPEKKKPTGKQSAYEQVLASVLAGKNLETGTPPAPPAPRVSRSLGRGRVRQTPERGGRKAPGRK